MENETKETAVDGTPANDYHTRRAAFLAQLRADVEQVADPHLRSILRRICSDELPAEPEKG